MLNRIMMQVSLGLSQIIPAVQIIMGSIVLALMAQIAIPLPFTPVPITLQTLAVAMLALTLGSRKAAWAVILYLVQASFGWPVIAGGISNPLWMIGPRAGYLLGFVVVAYIVGKVFEKKRGHTFFQSLCYFLCGEIIILCMGTLWLAVYVGGQNAIALGAMPFMAGSIFKSIVAATAVKPYHDLTK